MPKTAKLIYTLDAETDPFKFGRIPKPFLWGLYEGESDTFLTFQSTAAVCSHIRQMNAFIYAHNAGRFDYHFLAPYLDSGTRLKVINGRLAEFQMGRCTLRDSFCLLPFALDKYKKTEIDYGKFESAERRTHWDEIVDYLRDDCKYLWELVYNFEQRFNRHLTMASASMSTWSKMSGNKPPNTGGDFYRKFRKYYYGGRTQCFRHGEIKGRYQSLDINSAYPYAMLHAHPISQGYVSNPVKRVPKNIEHIGPRFYTLECVSLGAFPFVQNRKTYYPIDSSTRRLYHVTGWELAAAIETETARDIRIIRRYDFNETQSFEDYIQHFYNHRMEAIQSGDDMNGLFDKLFMNGLYGKFGSDPDRYRDFVYYNENDRPEIGDGDEREMLTPFADGFVHQTDSAKKRYYNIATSASITGFVRAFLWRHICQTKGPVYCDTDNILARDFHGFDMGDGLGQWGVEGEYDRLYVAGKKLYYLINSKTGDEKIAHKGIRATGKDIVDLVTSGKSIVYNPQAPTFSVKKSEPYFNTRIVTMTAEDMSKVPHDQKNN